MEFEGEEEIELSLGLAIGGRRVRSKDRLSEVPAMGQAEEKEVDLAMRREMQAMRRQEARRKREEKKRMKRGGGLRELRRCSINEEGNVEEIDEDERASKREKIDFQQQPAQMAKSDAVGSFSALVRSFKGRHRRVSLKGARSK